MPRIELLDGKHTSKVKRLCVSCFNTTPYWGCTGQGYKLLDQYDTCKAIGYLDTHRIFCMCVDENERGKKYGSRMLKHLMDIHFINHRYNAMTLLSKDSMSDKLYLKYKWTYLKYNKDGYSEMAYVHRTGQVKKKIMSVKERLKHTKDHNLTVEEFLTKCIDTDEEIKYHKIINNTNLIQEVHLKRYWFNHFIELQSACNLTEMKNKCHPNLLMLCQLKNKYYLFETDKHSIVTYTEL